MLPNYQSAKDFFESVKAASEEAWRTHLTLERMEASEGIHGSSFSGTHGTNSDVNGMCRTNARLDLEQKMQQRLEEDYELIDMAHMVIYGTEPFGGGIEKLLDSKHADCMYWRYMDGATWRKVAFKTTIGESTCRQYVNDALNLCDAYGLDAVAKGIGIACE